MAGKTVCPISREQFRQNAKPIEVIINGEKMTAVVKEFSTNSLGWNINNKLTIKIGDTAVVVQVGLNMTIVGSKDLPLDAASPKKEASAES